MNTKSKFFGRAVLVLFFLRVQYMVEGCSGTTRRGQRCKLFARPGHNTCRIHGGPQCPVCLEMMDLSTTRTLECRHSFHERCLERWKRTSRTCPMCREPFDLPEYKVRITIQRMADQHVLQGSYTTSNVSDMVSNFGFDAFMDPRYLTDIFFEIGHGESLNQVFSELGISLPFGPYAPAPVQSDQPDT